MSLLETANHDPGIARCNEAVSEAAMVLGSSQTEAKNCQTGVEL